MTCQELTDRIVLVTGAGRGIGRAVALSFAARGAHVALCSRSADELAAVANECRVYGVQAHIGVGDVSSRADVLRIVSDAEAQLGPIDILVNNAGVFWTAPALETDPEAFEQMMRVNVCGSVWMVQAVVPGMVARDRGIVINIGSLAGRKGYAEQSAYCASKHALLGFSKALALELADSSVRVTVLSPGGVDTGLIAAARPELDRSDWMDPQDIADAVLYAATLPPKMAIDEIPIRRRASVPNFV